MSIGDVIKDLDQISAFTVLSQLDEEVAETWVLRRAPDVRFLEDNATPMERPLKYWVTGFLIIVESTNQTTLGIIKTPKGHFLMMKRRE